MEKFGSKFFAGRAAHGMVEPDENEMCIRDRVEIEVIAEVFVDHGGAFQVPAGAAFPPGGGPEIVPV